MTPEETVSAFVDGEVLSRDEVVAALEDDAARRLLVESLIVRRMVWDAERVTVPTPTPVATRVIDRGWRTWVAAAAGIVCVAAAGFAIGRSGGPPSDEAPEPSRVIELRAGIEWKETGGGQ